MVWYTYVHVFSTLLPTHLHQHKPPHTRRRPQHLPLPLLRLVLTHLDRKPLPANPRLIRVALQRPLSQAGEPRTPYNQRRYAREPVHPPTKTLTAQRLAVEYQCVSQ